MPIYSSVLEIHIKRNIWNMDFDNIQILKITL
jgi:hypothetical protein